MSKKLFFLFLMVFFMAINSKLSSEVYISATVDDQIITNQDIKKEAKYLMLLNPNLNQIDNKKILDLSKESLIKEIIKKLEIQKVFDIEKKNQFVDDQLENFYLKLNFKNEDEFKNHLFKTSNYSLDEIKQKLKIEILWNELIYLRYSKQVVIDKNNFYKKIDSLDNKLRKEYLLSEIVFKKKKDQDLESLINRIKTSISEIGFSNTANIYSISDSSKSGGKIGWIDENNLSEIIYKELQSILEGQQTDVIKVGNNYLILKIEKINEKNIKIDKEEEFKKMVKFETNKQLNQFSKIFFDKSKINYSINEK